MKQKLASIAGLSALFGSTGAFAEYGLNLTRGVTPISREVYDLHMLILWICVAIGVVVFGAIFWSVINHRKSKGAVAAQFHESTTVEIIWTVVPFIILVFMAIPATKTLVAMEDVSDSDINIQVTGYQWKWGYDYLGEDVSFLSSLSTPREQVVGTEEKGEHYLLEVDNPLVVPINKKVRLSITASDVIHAWWVPELGGKKDAIPGFVNEMWFKVEKEGTYRGQCAELCGKDHGFMPIVVVAKNDVDYQQWLTTQKTASDADNAAADKEWSKTDLMARGESVYNTNCGACHQANGQGLPGVFPGLVGSAVATGPMHAHVDIVMNGKAGTAMAAYAGQLKDVDLAAVITYERNAWGNDAGDIIQPSEIKAAR
ncbi:MAG: cytochrome c oxidase subunit II [Gammaproteobacteria bacterium]